MNIGIVGTGLIGGTLARQFAQAGHLVFVSFSRSPEKLAALTAQTGPNVRAGTPAEAVAFGDVVVLSVHFAVMDEAIEQMGDVGDKVLIDTNNPFDIDLPPGTTAAQEVLRRLPGVRLVKAFNTLMYSELMSKSHHPPHYALPYAGNDATANEQTATLILAIGFEPVLTGSLLRVGLQEPGGPLYGQALTPEQARAILEQA